MTNYFRCSIFLFAVLSVVAMSAASAQSRWDTSQLRELGWKENHIGSGNTSLGRMEKTELERITGRTIRECLAYPGPGASRTFEESFDSLRIAHVALDRSGLRGLVVQGTGDCMCGATGNCEFWLIAEKPSGLKVVLQTAVIQTFEIEKTVSHGYFDVILGSNSSAWDMDLGLYHYTGGYYRRTACALMSYQGDHFQTLAVPTFTPRPCRGH